MGEEDSDVEAGEEEQGAYYSPSAAALGLTDYSQVDTLGVRCKPVNSRVEKSPNNRFRAPRTHTRGYQGIS